MLIFGLLAPPSPAHGEEMKFSELEGWSLNARFRRAQTIQADGKRFAASVDGVWHLTFGPDNGIEFEFNAVGHSPRGSRKAKPIAGTHTLDQPLKTGTRGGGDVIWRFADNTLTFVRTLPSGAFRTQFAFARASDGLTCAFNDAFARETGKGPVRLISPFNGRPVTILSAKVTSSTCKMSRKK
jgi:hypothetical protein